MLEMKGPRWMDLEELLGPKHKTEEQKRPVKAKESFEVNTCCKKERSRMRTSTWLLNDKQRA